MKVSIHWTYKHPKGRQVKLISDPLPASEALFLAEDFERTGRTKEIMFYDLTDQGWTKKELQQYLKGIETEPHDIVAFFDGGYDLATKKAGLGIVIYYVQNNKRYRIRKNSVVEEINSNNEAEYAALWLVIQELENLGVHHIGVTFKGDSQVVLNQLSGEWPVYEAEFNRWIDRIEGKIKSLGIKPIYEPVSRKLNKEADQLALQALKGIEINSRIELQIEE
ncbi:ribonuclease H family protein [Calidifontibacillus erzurumensis]|uniref:Reverse transcriptase-like protein n=1 Tax=Calidifontibacillus erzurumensis TaxID=2741433 RepID=A0A8J8GJ00_9BACI|nr:reverse transcriptase-like protein [Calidifontibacillus erzurumensis]NSL52633.1 reverse transcriptase-like protein [Calidifontibacillus erzurumensis]